MTLKDYLIKKKLIENIKFNFVENNVELVHNYLLSNYSNKVMSEYKSNMDVKMLANEILALYEDKWNYYVDKVLEPLQGTSNVVTDNKLDLDKTVAKSTSEGSEKRNHDFMGFNSEEFSQLNQDNNVNKFNRNNEKDRTQHRVISKTATDVSKYKDLLKYNDMLLNSPLLKVICEDVSEYITLRIWR